MDKSITIRDFFEKKETEFSLEIASGEEGLNRKITVAEINRMGLVLTFSLSTRSDNRFRRNNIPQITSGKRRSFQKNIFL